jgi:hypothetical protein
VAAVIPAVAVVTPAAATPVEETAAEQGRPNTQFNTGLLKMNFKLLIAAGIAASLISGPALAETKTAAWHGQTGSLQLVDNEHHERNEGRRPQPRRINANQAAAIAKSKGFQVLGVNFHDGVFIIKARRNGGFFTVIVGLDGRFLSAQPVRGGRDRDDHH